MREEAAGAAAQAALAGGVEAWKELDREATCYMETKNLKALLFLLKLSLLGIVKLLHLTSSCLVRLASLFFWEAFMLTSFLGWWRLRALW